MRLLVALADPAERSVVRESVRDLETIEILSYAGSGTEAVQMAAARHPEIVLLAAELPLMDGFQAARMITLHAPATRVVLASPAWNAGQLQRAMAAGVRKVIGLALDADELRETLRGIVAEEHEREGDDFVKATDPKRAPATVAVCGSKGGVGKSTLAVNLAAALARLCPGSVALVDLYPQFGDIASMMDARPRRTLADLAGSGEEIDSDLLGQLAVVHASGVAAFVGATSPQPLDLFSAGFVDTLVAALRHAYRFVVLDIPPLLFSGTLAAFTRADHVLVVCPVTEISAAASTRCFIDVLSEGYVSAERLHVIANRTGRGAVLQIPELEEVLSRKVSVQIPNDERRLQSAANEGQPAVLCQGRGPAAAAISALAQRVHDRLPLDTAGSAARRPREAPVARRRWVAGLGR